MNEKGYSTREVAALVGVPPARLSALVRGGALRASRGARGELRFAFTEVALLRSVRGIEQCSPARLAAAIRHLQRWSARRHPLSVFRVEAEGTRLVARDERGAFEARSGQTLLPFEALPVRPAQVVRVKQPMQAEGFFMRGVRLEPTSMQAAMRAYERALVLDPEHVGACVNLGRLRHLLGNPAGATVAYEQAIALAPEHATAHFNLGVALEDLGRIGDALACYERAVAHDPSLADAHYNAARLCERQGDQMGAFRHMRRYRTIGR